MSVVGKMIILSIHKHLHVAVLRYTIVRLFLGYITHLDKSLVLFPFFVATEISLKRSACGLAVLKVISIVQVIVSLLVIIHTNIVSIRYVCMESLYVFCWTDVV